MSLLNLLNTKEEFFDDVFLMQNTGYSSIYNIFGSKTELSSLSGINTTTLTQITNTITGLSTLNSALATKATITSVSDINNTLPSLIAFDYWNTTLFPNTMSVVSTNFAALGTTYSVLRSHTTSITNINATLPSLITNTTLTSNLDNYTPLTTYNNTITTRLDSQLNIINNINTTIPSLITNSTLTSNLNNYTPLSTYNNTILTRLNTDFTNISNLQTTTQSLITSATLSSRLTGYLTVSGNATTSSLLALGNTTCSSNLNVLGNLTCSSLRTNGTLSATTTFQTVYTITTNTRGFITFTSSSSSMVMCFFEWTSGTTFASLTLIAQSGNATQPTTPSTPGLLGAGTQQITVQLSGQSIQIRTASASTVSWNVILF